MSAPAATERTCPECQAPIPVLPGYPDWCDRCGWNLKPPPTPEELGDRFTELARSLGKHSGDRMARELLAAPRLEPRWTPAKIAAIAVAAGVHLLALALIVGGVAAIVVEFPNPISILIGLAMLGAGVVMRPRFDKVAPGDGHPLGPAVTGLARLARLLRPLRLRAGLMEDGFAEWVASGLMRLVSLPVDAVLWLEAHLLLRDMQRAEYLADALAAEVAGSASVVALHANLLMRSTVELAVQQASHANATDALDPIRVAVHGVPERERERRRRAARLEDARLDSSHPPTGVRIALIEGRPAAEPRVVLNQAGSRRIDAELEPLADRVSREVLDAYRAGLYEG